MRQGGYPATFKIIGWGLKENFRECNRKITMYDFRKLRMYSIVLFRCKLLKNAFKGIFTEYYISIFAKIEDPIFDFNDLWVR